MLLYSELFDFDYPPLRSIDFFDEFFGYFGGMDMTNGLLDDCGAIGMLVFMKLVGFVGYMIKWPLLSLGLPGYEFYGFAVAASGLALVEWNPFPR